MHVLIFFIVVPVFISVLLPLLPRWGEKAVDILVAAVSVIMFLASIAAFSYMSVRGPLIFDLGGFAAPLGIDLVLDGLSGLLLIVISLVTMMVVFFSVDYMKKFTAKARYYALLMLLVSGVNGVVLSGDFFNMFIFLEVVAISSYFLVAFGCGGDELEAAFKYMVQGTISSLFILLAIAFLYSLTGTLNMAHASAILKGAGASPAASICLILFLAGFSLKAALVPFHGWLPDAHPSAPAPVSAMLSAVVIKSVGAYALVRTVFNVFGMTHEISEVLLFLGAASMIIGVLSALGQWDLKRLLAYHSVSQMGYVIFGIALATPLGILGGLFHLFNHAVFKSLLFLDSGAVEYSVGTRNLKEMGGLKDPLPVTSLTTFLASLSIAGIPPLNGFWSKLMIIIAAVLSRRYAYAMIAVIASILTLSSFLKVIKYGFYGTARERAFLPKEVPTLMRASMIGLAAICVLAGIFFPYVVTYLINPAVRVLLDGLHYSGFILGG